MKLTLAMDRKLREVFDLRGLIKNGRDEDGNKPNGMTLDILKQCERELGKLFADQYYENED